MQNYLTHVQKPVQSDGVVIPWPRPLNNFLELTTKMMSMVDVLFSGCFLPANFKTIQIMFLVGNTVFGQHK
ncbi:hypothetical protein TcasGA2_TC033764 [Tribolium castaneum]|uniref:Uncharacterized protein n=1 Tax=Tribolium castaneum TaxID=7070 RepID=A0A139WF61_TRICA|nr:hypothetical protein TcasGA2_TC033764 [Tribolium castaneum]